MPMIARGSVERIRTSFHVESGGVEVIRGATRPWAFRPHYHDGEEVVRLLQGRARLRLHGTVRDVAAGDTVVVPAKVVHRFEPVDGVGWAFASHFIQGGTQQPVPAVADRATLSGRVIEILSGRPSLLSGIDEIAARCALSKGYVARVFRRETGSSLHNFHVVYGLHRAKTLLREDVRVVDAALEAGFYDQAHLNREFVRTFGMTPATFQAAWRNAAP